MRWFCAFLQPPLSLPSLSSGAGGTPIVMKNIMVERAVGDPLQRVRFPEVQAHLHRPLVPEHISGRPRSFSSAVQRGSVLSQM